VLAEVQIFGFYWAQQNSVDILEVSFELFLKILPICGALQLSIPV
jgi:hypothetical protein